MSSLKFLKDQTANNRPYWRQNSFLSRMKKSACLGLKSYTALSQTVLYILPRWGEKKNFATVFVTDKWAIRMELTRLHSQRK